MIRFTEPVIKECVDSFREIVGIDMARMQKNVLDRNTMPELAFTAMIGLTGENSNGFIALSMNNNFALAIAKKMTGNAASDIDEDVDDAIGELINIISGRVKMQFKETASMKMTVPKFFHGAHNGFPPNTGILTFINFPEASPDQFVLVVSLDKKNEAVSLLERVNLSNGTTV
jgi:chemotaxis protein CheX